MKQHPMTTPIEEPLEVILKPCRLCGDLVPVVLPGPNGLFREDIERLAAFVVHNHCQDANEAAKFAAITLAKVEKRLEQWKTICPEEFRKVLESGGRGYNAARLSKMLEWQFNAKGLFVVGQTRQCKTRFTYHLLFREYQAGKTVGAWLHSDLRRELSAIAAGSSEGLDKFLRRLLTLEILFIDDLGKGRATPASEESFFAIVDGRARACLPTFYTANKGSLEHFLAGLTEEYRAPLSARIEETTQKLEFKH